MTAAARVAQSRVPSVLPGKGSPEWVTVELRRLSRRLGAHSISLRDATERLRLIYVESVLATLASDLWADVRDSRLAIAAAERRLGEVLVVDAPASRTDAYAGADGPWPPISELI